VVSEETGGISVAYGGKIERNIPPQRLAKAISQHIINTEPERPRRVRRRAFTAEKQGDVAVNAEKVE
jgi:hypothetical protein